MSKHTTQSGVVNTALIGVIALLVLGGAWWYTHDSKTSDDAMMKKDESAMMDKEGGEMMKDEHMMEDGTMMKDEDSMMKKDESAMMEKEDDATMKKEETSFNGAVIAGSSAPLLEFDQRDYESAIASGKTVVLYFFANWCPLCKKEFIDTKAAFDAYEGSSIVGFRVHFSDDEVTPEMENLAREFGVAYQHTKVFIQNGERVLKSPETWDKDRYLNEFTKFTN